MDARLIALGLACAVLPVQALDHDHASLDVLDYDWTLNAYRSSSPR